MTLAQATALIGVLFMLLVGVITWVFRDALATLRSAVKDLNKSLESVNDALQSSAEPVLAEKIRALENDYGLLHTFKNVMLPSQLAQLYQNATGHSDRRSDELSRRLDRIESKVFNGAK